MRLSVLYFFYAIHFFAFSAFGYNITVTSTVTVGEPVQASFFSEFPVNRTFQPDYIIVLAKGYGNGKYPRDPSGTTFIQTGNKEQIPSGTANFIIPQEGKYRVQMYERTAFFGESDDIVAVSSNRSAGATGSPSSVTAVANTGSESGEDNSGAQKSPLNMVVILVSVLGSIILICATVIFIFWYRARRFGRQESARADFSSQASSTVLFKGSKMLRDAPIPPGSTYLSTTVAPSDSISQIGHAPKFIPHLPGYQGRDMRMGAGRKYEESISESELEYPYNRRRSDIEKADGIRDDGLNFPYSIPVITTTAATPSPPSTLVESLRNGRRDRY